MKKLILLFALLLAAATSNAQTFPSNVIKKDKNFKMSSPELKARYDISVPITVMTPALQLTFTQIEKLDGQWKLTTPICVGYSYIYSLANGIIHQDSSITVENHLFFGGGFNFGLVPKNGVLVGSLPVGGIIGFSKYGLFGGVDVLNGKPLVAVSINLLNFPVLQSLTKIKIKN